MRTWKQPRWCFRRNAEYITRRENSWCPDSSRFLHLWRPVVVSEYMRTRLLLAVCARFTNYLHLKLQFIYPYISILFLLGCCRTSTMKKMEANFLERRSVLLWEPEEHFRILYFGVDYLQSLYLQNEDDHYIWKVGLHLDWHLLFIWVCFMTGSRLRYKRLFLQCFSFYTVYFPFFEFF